jgi:hypothetical protein
MSTASHLFSALAFGAIAASSLLGHGKAGLTDGGGDGLGIPGLGGDNAPQSCTITTADPRNRNSCNSTGGDGVSGENGYVHGNAGRYEDYHDDPDYRDYINRHSSR